MGAILIWLVTQRTPEIVFDDAKQPISVTIGPAIPATDVLGDVINIAAAATRLDPSLRPLTADLEERLSLSYRWLEPVNRSALEILVRSYSSPSELDGGPLSFSGSATPFNENLKFKRIAKSKLHPNNLAPWRKAQDWIKRVRREEGRPAHNDSGWAGLASTASDGLAQRGSVEKELSRQHSSDDFFCHWGSQLWRVCLCQLSTVISSLTA